MENMAGMHRSCGCGEVKTMIQAKFLLWPDGYREDVTTADLSSSIFVTAPVSYSWYSARSTAKKRSTRQKMFVMNM